MQKLEEVRRLPPLLLRFWIGIIVLSALSLAYTAFMTWRLHPRIPYALALLYGQDFGWDFLVYQHRFTMFRGPGFWTPLEYPLTYPALLGVVFAGLYKLPHPLRDYLLLVVAGMLTWVAWLGRRLHAEGISGWRAWGFALTVLLLLWPAWLEIDTGNIEGVVAITLGVGMVALARRSWWLAASFIALAGAMKLFPLLLLGVLLARRRYQQFAYGLLLAFVVNLASLAVLGPSVVEAQRQINRGFTLLTNNFGLSVLPDALDANHSLYIVVKTAVVVAHHQHLVPDVGDGSGYAEQARRDRAMLLMPYRVYLVAMAVLGLALYFLCICRLPMLNQMLALTLCGVLMPPVSMDYTLLHLLVPFGLLCILVARRSRLKLPTPGAALCLACFAIIFTADTYFSVKYRMVCQARALTLVLLLAAVCRYRFAWPELGETAASNAKAPR